MNTMDEKYSRLRDRAERTFAGHPVVEVIDRTRAIIGLMHLPADETDAQQALDTLRRGEEPTAVQLAALELMVRLMRPAPLSKKGELQPLPEQNEYNKN